MAGSYRVISHLGCTYGCVKNSLVNNIIVYRSTERNEWYVSPRAKWWSMNQSSQLSEAFCASLDDCYDHYSDYQNSWMSANFRFWKPKNQHDTINTCCLLYSIKLSVLPSYIFTLLFIKLYKPPFCFIPFLQIT